MNNLKKIFSDNLFNLNPSISKSECTKQQKSKLKKLRKTFNQLQKISHNTEVKKQEIEENKQKPIFESKNYIQEISSLKAEIINLTR